MSTEHATVASDFTQALLKGQVGTLTSATRVAYASGAEVRDLLVVVDNAQAQGGVSPLLAEHARSTVYAWQWIGDRRRALA